MGTQKMLRVITRHTLEAIFQVMEATVKLSQRAKTIEKNCHPEKLATASPGNPMDVTKPNLLSLFVQQDEKCLEWLTSLEETYVLTTFGKKPMRKVRSESKLASLPTVVHVAYSAS